MLAESCLEDAECALSLRQLRGKQSYANIAARRESSSPSCQVAVVVKTHGISSWGRCTTHFRTYFSGDWDVHWGCAVLTHGQMVPHVAVCVLGAPVLSVTTVLGNQDLVSLPHDSSEVRLEALGAPFAQRLPVSVAISVLQPPHLRSMCPPRLHLRPVAAICAGNGFPVKSTNTKKWAPLSPRDWASKADHWQSPDAEAESVDLAFIGKMLAMIFIGATSNHKSPPKLSCSVAPRIQFLFPFFCGGCPTKSGLPKKGFPFFQGHRTTEQTMSKSRSQIHSHVGGFALFGFVEFT